ncbi:hypothetical protein [Rhodalgimonas zhirmunskyi]|nr:hypothetical protein [Rhodoalgimonas zhirmunskyi]
MAIRDCKEVPMHIRATANTGASKRDVIKGFRHTATLRPRRFASLTR